MIYLDTHVVIWLYADLAEKFNPQARELINKNDLFVSPIVSLEIQYLYEIGRITVDSNNIISDMEQRIGLRICDAPFSKVTARAIALSWTRDPFDRLIVAQAQVGQSLLLTRDELILARFDDAVWP